MRLESRPHSAWRTTDVGVRKFRSVEEMPSPRPLPPLDPANLAVACELTELAYKLRPWHFEPGVRKFRSIEDANRVRNEREKAQVRRRSELD